jgi:alkanesulfonate monooxygenase
MKLQFHWRCLDGSEAKAKDHSVMRHDVARGSVDLESQARFCREAEDLGIDSLLMNVGYAVPDPLLLATSLAARTQRIGFMSAFRPGLMSPTLFVQQVNTFSNLYPGRISLNIVAGHSPVEQAFYGDHLGHDERYDRMGEFLTVCRALWEQDAPVTFKSEYYNIRDGQLHTPFCSPLSRRPLIYVGGNSEPCQRLACQHADVWMRFPAPQDELAASIRPVIEAGREVGLRMAVLARPTRREALEAARALIPDQPDAKTSVENAFVQGADSHSIQEVHAMGSREWLSPVLWTGAVRQHGAPSVTFLGSYDEVADQILALKELGVTQYILHGWPKWDEMRRFGAEVLPRVRDREQTTEGLSRLSSVLRPAAPARTVGPTDPASGESDFQGDTHRAHELR